MSRARALSVAITLAAAATAFASVSGLLDVAPEVVVVTTPASMTGQGSSVLHNSTAGAIMVSSFARMPCDDTGMVVVSPTPPFSLAAGSQQNVVFDCPATATFGMRRCTYHAQGALMNELATFMGVCETASAANLSAPATLDFGTVNVGTTAVQHVQLTNAGSATVGTLQLQVTELGGNILLGAPCNPNANGCNVTNTAVGSFGVDVLCRPSAATTYSAALHVVDDAGDRLASPIAVTCTGATTTAATIHISTDPAPLDLGAVEVQGGSATGTVHIANVGTADPLTVQSIAISGAGTDWTYTLGNPCNGTLPCVLATGESVDVSVKLVPSSLGARSATMTIASNDALNAQVAVRLYGTGQGATLELAPGATANIDLGQVPRNGSASLPVLLANHGNRDVTDVTLAYGSGADPHVTAPASLSVAHGATPTPLAITCAPGGTTGTFTTTMTASAPDAAGSVAITATCHGTDSKLASDPTALQLGEVRTGTSPAPSFAFALVNNDSQPMTLAAAPSLAPAQPALAISGPASLAIAAGGSAAASLDVDPTMDQDLTTTITAADTSGNHTLVVPVSGRLVTATLTAPSSVDLGTFCVNEPTTPTTIAAIATGTGSVVVMAPQVAQPSQLNLTPRFPSDYPARLANGAGVAIDVAPARAGSAIDVSGDLVWSSDAGSPHTTVHAKFLAAGAAIAPASLDFGAQSIHLYVKDGQPVTIQNCDTTGTLALHPSIDPPFSIDSDFPSQLVAAETATFAIGFHPTSQMAFIGDLRITTSASPDPLVVKLTGIGSATGVPDDGGSSTPPTLRDTSVYACSCTSTSPGGALPVALALVCVLFPRRRRMRAHARLVAR